jgi:hypothetical protein
MEKTTQRLLLSCGVILLAACLCLSVTSIAGAGLFIFNRSSALVLNQPPGTAIQVPFPIQTEEATETISATPQPVVTVTVQPNPTTQETSPTEPQSDLPPNIARQMDAIQSEVVRLRDLQPKGAVNRALLTPDQLRQKVIDDFLKDYSPEEAANDTISLSAFGLLEPDFDLLDFYIELYSEQVAGFYDDQDKTMYVVQGEGFNGNERLTYAHEYVHALQDQNFDLENGLNYSDQACEEDSERCSAVQALLEGDASSLEIEWLTNYATNQDLNDIQEFYNTYQSPVYDSAPAYLKEDFIFPYLNGQTFIEQLKSQGGWPAVNEAYQNLPVSTEQILHPDLYPDDQPVPVDLPDLSEVLGSDWREVDRGVMGEWYTYLILGYSANPQARLNETTAQDAAAGWGGDAYVVYYNDQAEDYVMVLRTVWDTQADANEFSAAFKDYSGARFNTAGTSDEPGITVWDQPGRYVALRADQETTTWLLAPDESSALNVWEQLPSQ